MSEPGRWPTRYHIAVAAFGSAALIALAAGLGFDAWLADRLFDFDTGQWAIPRHAGVLRLLLYDGPKWFAIATGLLLLAILAFPQALGRGRLGRRQASYLFACMALVPGLIGLVKGQSGVSCPAALAHFGGMLPDELGRVHWAGWLTARANGGCWPSAHVTTAGAFSGWFFVPAARLWRWTAGVLVIAAGFALGAYQVLRGAHFASHVAITLGLSYLIAASLARLWFPPYSVFFRP